MSSTFAVGSLVRAREREWVVLPGSEADLLILRPLGGSEEETTGVYLPLEKVEPASFAPPSADDIGDFRSARLLRDALRLSVRSSTGPFRCFGRIAVAPRPYQAVPLLMALKLDPVRLLIADDVGVGKTVESCLIAKEMLEQGTVRRLAVICPPHLAPQWQKELEEKFHIEAVQVLPSTAGRLERGLRMDETLFDRYPHVVVSLDFIKSDRRREEFVNRCPEFVIVDEAHACADPSGGKGHMQRYELVSRLADDPARHLVLVTATPHAGKEDPFRSLLGFLDRSFVNLPQDLSQTALGKERRRLAKHLVQRRRGDIRAYLGTETVFPEREARDETYTLSDEHKEFFQRVLRYCRETVRDSSGGQHRQRVRWWAALGLLRAVGSSPAAAAATLRERAKAAGALTEKEADELGRRAVLDMADDESIEGIDVAPGAGTDSGGEAAPVPSRRLNELAKFADSLGGPKDRKLQGAIKLIHDLISEGFRPIVFCRFINTAEYLGEALDRSSGTAVKVEVVTGKLPAEEREKRVATLGASGEKHVLVATDCLAEGINLQEHFDAVVHYDLSWSPTRHEQREGRVDRFGQTRPEVRVLTYYGVDNPIDGIILSVLLRKHRKIRSDLGIAVPVPVDTNSVLEAILEGLLLSGRTDESIEGQLALFEKNIVAPRRAGLHAEWDTAVAREKRSRTVFAQQSLDPGAVAAELQASLTAVGSTQHVRTFVGEAITACGGTISQKAGRLTADVAECPAAIREAALVSFGSPSFDLRFEPDQAERGVFLPRTHPFVGALSSYVLDSAIDPGVSGGKVPARRAGVIRSRAVTVRTTLLLLRYRFDLITNGFCGEHRLLAEEAGLLAFQGSPESPRWLDQTETEALVSASPDANVGPGQARNFVALVVDALESLRPRIEAEAGRRAQALLEAHTRVREGMRLKGIRYQVEAKPTPTCSACTSFCRCPDLSRNQAFLAIQSLGAILPPDTLERIACGDGIEGLDPGSYHLAQGERLGEAVTRSWSRMVGLWSAFKDALANVPEGDPATTLTRERLSLPLFQELGYGRLQTAKAVELEGRPFPISHAWNSVPIHLVGHRVTLDRRTKGVAGAATASPHTLVQELLNHSAARLYGLVSNGQTLRLLRDNNSLTRQAYIEFDLAQIFENELYSEFFLLWLVCHESRFAGDPVEECWLEQWHKRAASEGTRALQDLRKAVETAITVLGRGFLAHPANQPLREALRAGDLAGGDYYRQLLRCIYRLIFLFVAEDRDVLIRNDAGPDAKERFRSYYCTAQLRQLAGKIPGSRHSDLYERVKVVFRALGAKEGAPGLGLPGLGSFLWSDRATPHLDQASLFNSDLCEAIRALAFVVKGGFRRVMDYRNLGSEELGSVYESLLELHPLIRIDATAHEDRFKLETLPGHERRTTGSYYTPRELVASLLDTALDPVLDMAARSPHPEDAILSLRICDPAAGSGHFLISAAHRMAKRLAAARSGEEEPVPPALRRALRDVVSHCLYAVDVNPMAVELCKISLWMESVEGGQPLSFLDSHIKIGNSLLGTAPELIEAGIPDAAFTALSGDDKQAALSLKRQNKLERDQELTRQGVQLLFDFSALNEVAEALAERARELDGMPEQSVAAVRQKEQAHSALLASDPYRRAKLTADAWCAAFFQEKTKDSGLRITQGLVRRLSEDSTAVSAAERNAISAMSAALGFFHWHVEFPEVFGPGGTGGFDVVLGNPPWERVKLQEKEFFASRAPVIANARNKAERQRLIEQLKEENPALGREFGLALRKAEGESHFIRTSGRFPLCGRGDVNTYSIFGEAMRSLGSPAGRAGCVLPSGIATDDTTRHFFADLVDRRSLVSLFDFENRRGIFPGVHRSYKFCLLTLTGSARPADQAEFVFFAQAVSDLVDEERRFTLSPEDFALLNPNTRTCPIFRTRRDAQITKGIYRRVPVLIDQAKGAAGNPWGITFFTMFHMSNDSRLFRIRSQLEAQGFALEGNVFVKGKERWLPLYEAKMVHHFNHRFGDYALVKQGSADTHLRAVPPAMLADPDCAPLPRYWVPEHEVTARLKGRWDAGWLLGWRDVARSTDERTVIASVIPRVGAGDKILFMMPAQTVNGAKLLPILNSLPFDYIARQKQGGISLKFYLMKQIPLLPPFNFTQHTPWYPGERLLKWLTPRILELVYTSWDLQPFARDLGYDGPPFRWDPERRFRLRCELDAAFFHLYGISAEDAGYILETFPILKRKNIADFGEYRTRNRILEIYDAMAKAIATGEPYRTIVDPPPAHASVAHPPREPVAARVATAGLRLLEAPGELERYRTVVPLLDLKAAAGAFGDVQAVEELGWVEVPGHKLREGMFVAQVVGHSMQPRIPSGSYCLFAHPAGSNQGKIVLAQHRDIEDPETGGSYTVKRYRSEKKFNDDGTWQHTEIRLEPLNPAFEPIIIRQVEEGELRLIAKLVDVYAGALGEP